MSWGGADIRPGDPDCISPNRQNDHLFPESSWMELPPWGPDIHQMERREIKGQE